MEIGLRNWRDKQGERSNAFFTRDALAQLAAIFGRSAIVPIGGLNVHGFVSSESTGILSRDESR
jgi:hypothetical protein